jgi:hypothetical protein
MEKMMNRLSGRLLAAAGTFSLFAAGAVALASPAAAGPSSQCGGSQTVTFSPAVTQTPQNVTVTTNTVYSPCDIGVTATGLTVSTFANFACTPGDSTLLATANATETITWTDDNNTSTVTWGPGTTAGNTTTRTGTVTAGRYVTQTTEKTATAIGNTTAFAECEVDGTPVSTVSSAVTLDIFGT